MNEKQYSISLELVEKMLREINVFRDRRRYYKSPSIEFLDHSKHSDYITLYKTAIKNFDYSILLIDESFYQFFYKDNEIRYAYYQCPYDLEENVIDLFSPEFEQILSEAPEKKGFISIRYDYDKQSYNPGIHAVSHIHIGHLTEVRLPVSKIITPYCFTMFILHHIYYNNWKSWMKLKVFKDNLKSIKKDCIQLEKKFFDSSDKIELYFE